jgi:hypothetical protein
MTDSLMTDTATIPPVDAPPLPGLMARVIGVITSPGETFKHIVRTPKVAGALFVCSLAMALAAGLPQFTERGRAAAFEAQVEAFERMGMTVSDEMYAQLQARSQSNTAGYMTTVSTFVAMPVGSVFITAIMWAVFNTILGGLASFKHVMSVVVHSQIIMALSGLIAAPIMYARDQVSMSGIANLGGLVSFLDESSFLARFLGMIDLFFLWWLVVLAIGLATLYKRTTTGVATGLIATYVIFALAIASIFAG